MYFFFCSRGVSYVHQKCTTNHVILPSHNNIITRLKLLSAINYGPTSQLKPHNLKPSIPLILFRFAQNDMLIMLKMILQMKVKSACGNRGKFKRVLPSNNVTEFKNFNFLYFIEIRQCIGITETYTEIIFILQFLGFWFDINQSHKLFLWNLV